MSEIVIFKIGDPKLAFYHDAIHKGLREIFFEASTKKDFESEKAKEDFFHKYVGFYLQNYSQWCWVAWEKQLLGYVIAAPYSDDPELWQLQPHMETFQEFFKKFPAHLHINCHVEARGKGLGSKLLKEVIQALQKAEIGGLHIMTGPESQNRTFYQRLGFDFEKILTFNGRPILFMGKKL